MRPDFAAFVIPQEPSSPIYYTEMSLTPRLMPSIVGSSLSIFLGVFQEKYNQKRSRSAFPVEMLHIFSFMKTDCRGGWGTEEFSKIMNKVVRNFSFLRYLEDKGRQWVWLIVCSGCCTKNITALPNQTKGPAGTKVHCLWIWKFSLATMG